MIDLPKLTTLTSEKKPDDDDSSFRNVMCITLEGIILPIGMNCRYA